MSFNIQFEKTLAKKFSDAFGKSRVLMMDYIGGDYDVVYYKKLKHGLVVGVNRDGDILIEKVSRKAMMHFHSLHDTLYELPYNIRGYFIDSDEDLDMFGVTLLSSLSYIGKVEADGIIEMDTDIIEFSKRGNSFTFRYRQFV